MTTLQATQVPDTLRISFKKGEASFRLPTGANSKGITVIRISDGEEIPFEVKGRKVVFSAGKLKYQACVEIPGQTASYGTLDLREKKK